MKLEKENLNWNKTWINIVWIKTHVFFPLTFTLTLNRDFPVEGKNNQQVYKKESWLLIVQQQNPVRKNVRQGLFMTVRPIFWPDSDPASQLASQRAFWMIDQVGGLDRVGKMGGS